MFKNKNIIYLFLIVISIPIFFIDSFTMDQKLTLLTLIIALVLWFTKLLSFFLIAIFIISIIIGGRILPIAELIDISLSNITFFLLGIFIIVEAIKRSNIPEMIINKGILVFGTHMLKLLFFSPLYLLLVIPDPISRIIINIPLLKSLKKELTINEKNESLYSLFYIIIPYIGMASVLVYPLAAPSRLLAYHILNDYNEIDISFLKWFILSFQLVLVFSLALYYFIKGIKKVEWKLIEGNLSELTIASDYKFKSRDKKLLYLLSIILLVFFTRGIIHNLELGFIAIAAGLLLFTPFIKFFPYR